MISSVREQCFHSSFFTDGLAWDALQGNDYSQHSQIWAVLCGAIAGEEAIHLLQNTLARADFILTSTAMSFYKFRAVSIAGVTFTIRSSPFGTVESSTGE